MGVSRVLEVNNEGVSRVLEGSHSHKGIKRCYTGISRVLLGCYKSLTRML